ncbi:N-acetyltransferase [Bizionia sp. KMM 8389]
MIEEQDLFDNDFLRQFELKSDDQLAIIEYSLQERKIFLTKLIIPSSIFSETFKDEFIKIVLKNIEERNLSVMPTSPDIVKFIRKNRQYRSMLPVGVRI